MSTQAVYIYIYCHSSYSADQVGDSESAILLLMLLYSFCAGWLCALCAQCKRSVSMSPKHDPGGQAHSRMRAGY